MTIKMKHVCALLFLIGLALRLPNLLDPRQIVFDEVYFGKFATAYCCKHETIFDIHPPHAKLLIAGTAKLFGQTPDFNFEGLGSSYPEDVAVFGLRLAPALAGALVPSLVAVLIFLLNGSVLAAFTGGFLMAWDNGLWVQSRIVALDPILIAAVLGSFITALIALRQSDMRTRCLWMLGSGAATGMALGSKFTGLACFPLVGLLLLEGARRGRPSDRWWVLGREIVWFACGFCVIYFAGWWIHFQLLYKPGPGDAFFIPSGSFFNDVVDLHRIMFLRNAQITTPHPYASHWYTWLLMKRPIFYWSGGDKVIYLIGNPVVWYGVLVAFLLSVCVWLEKLIKTRTINLAWFPLLAVIANLLPLTSVTRPLFLYHYFPTYVFMTVFSAVVLAEPVGQWLWRKPWRIHVAFVAACLVIIGFVMMLPMTNATSVGFAYREWVYQRIPTWR